MLPFGLSSAPYVSTKVFRPLVKHLHSRGIPLVLYLDDSAGCLHDISVAQNTASVVRSDLANAGVVANEEKFIWVLTQILEWLGIACLGSFAWPHIYFSSPGSVTPRAVASVTGQIISLTPGYGNITLLMSRFLQSFVKLQSNWDCPLDFRSYRPPHTSRFFVGRQKICTCRLVCGEFRQVSDKIGACRARSDSARSQNVLSGLVG